MNFVGKSDAKLPVDGLGAHPNAHLHVDSWATHAPSDAIIVPDAHLLFTGDFKRSGVDLILSDDDHRLVLRDYFKGENRAALSSPDGAHLTGDIVNALTGHVEYAQAGGGASVAQVIGHVTKLAGTATAIRNGVSIILNQGDNVEKGDVLQSGSDSTVGVTFIDGTVFGLSSNARMVLNEMIYDPNGSNNSSLLSLVAGTISFVAGETAKHGDMKVDTPVATMGIRGTAVLVEIDFNVPQGDAPDAKFQVLVEPDGTTGSYILFDKATLTPIATVNQAGTQVSISHGNVNFSATAPMSAEMQKLITDVFTLKFSDNSNVNTKTADHFTDTLTPQSFAPFILANGTVAIPVFVNINTLDKPSSSNPNGPTTPIQHIDLPPSVVATSGSFIEHPGVTGSSALDSVSGKISFVDINAGDLPTAKAVFNSFSYLDAHNNNITATLTATELAAVKAVEIPLSVNQDPGNTNNGTATWTYSLPDGAFDFLGAGETLTLTYLAQVNNNYAPNNEITTKLITVTITGTNDAPTIATAGSAILERVGTGLTATDTASGTVTFTDVDLTDRPVVSASFASFKYLDSQHHDVTLTLSAAQIAAVLAVETPLVVTQTAGNTNSGSATWTYSLPDKSFDFLARGETLILNYVAEVDDGHGGIVSTPITVSINGADVTVTGTNDSPVLAADTSGAAGSSLHAITEIAGKTGDTTDLDTASGTLAFTDVDLSDTHTVSESSPTYVWSGGHLTTAQTNALTAAATLALTEHDSTGTGAGSVGFAYSAADHNFDFLGAGQTLTVTYDVTVTDNNLATSTQPVTFTITGTNDAPVLAADTSGAAGTSLHAITEHVGTTGDTTDLDTASGTLAFTDVDLSDTHTVSESSPTYVWSGGHLTTAQTNALTAAATLALTEHDSTGTGAGSVDFTYSAADNNFDFLAAGQTLTVTYDITVTDNNHVTSNEPVTMTITGTNDSPVLAADTSGAAGSSLHAITEHVGTTGDTTDLDTASGTLAFTDVDLSDTHTVSESSPTYVWSGGHLTTAQTNALTAAATLALTEHDSTGTGAGSVDFTYSAADNNFDFLAAGQTLTVTYNLTVTDNNDVSSTQPITITITGSNDAPVIVGETDPSMQTIILTKSPTVLGAGITTNSLGMHTETFDGHSAGSASNNGFGHGNFTSLALDATFTSSGHAGVVHGSSPVTASPFIGPLPGHADTTNYLSIGAHGTETITFAGDQNEFGLYWGSADSFNTITFYDGNKLVASYSGADVTPLLANGNQGSFSSNGYVEFSDLAPFDKVVLGTGGSNAFEIDNVSAGFVSDSHVHLASPITGTLTVSDADIGDTLTASVTGNAVVEYNGSTTLPSDVNVAALIDPHAVTFDSVKTTGGSDVLDWTYNPTDADLDFLEPGDTLSVTFKAQVSDGHVATGDQSLTVTLVGAGSSVVNGTSQNDMFADVGGGVTIFGRGGQDTFVFNKDFGSATVGDFNVNNDTIDIDHSLFASVSALLASAQPANFGHDTIITDAAHDKITLAGVTVAQIQAHPNDFHLI